MSIGPAEIWWVVGGMTLAAVLLIVAAWVLSAAGIEDDDVIVRLADAGYSPNSVPRELSDFAARNFQRIGRHK